MFRTKRIVRPHGTVVLALCALLTGGVYLLLRQQKDLRLSAEQTAKIKAITTDYEKGRIREEADLKLAEVDVETLVHDEKANLSAIEAARKKSESAHTALRLGGVKALRAAAALLTPE